MTEGEILDLFIRAAEIDHRLPNAPKPPRLKAQSLPFIHSREERSGWEPADFSNGSVITRKDHLGNDMPISEAQRRLLKRQMNDRLEYGDSGRLDIQAKAFWNGKRLTTEDVGEWELAMELMRHVSRERNRRCLWAYAKSRAKVLIVEVDELFVIAPKETDKVTRRPYQVVDTVRQKISFSKWCVEVEDIHRNYGKTCADHAIAEIALKAFGNVLFPNENVGKRTLQNGPDFGHIPATMDNSASDSRMTVDGWCVRDANKALRKFDSEIIHVPLTDLRNARRRQREARKREAA